MVSFIKSLDIRILKIIVKMKLEYQTECHESTLQYTKSGTRVPLLRKSELQSSTLSEVGVSRHMAYKYITIAGKNVESIQQIGVTS